MAGSLGRTGSRARRRIVALLVAAIVATAACQAVTRSGDPVLAHPPDPTGSYRTGLTRAGLVAVTALGDAHLWLATSDGRRDQSVALRVELLNNGAPVASGVQPCLTGVSTDAHHPSETVVPWSAFAAPSLKVGDVLALRVSTHAGTGSAAKRCANDDRPTAPAANNNGKGGPPRVQLFFDAKDTPSRFAATITPDSSVPLYLHSDPATCDAKKAIPTTRLSLSNVAPTATQPSCVTSGATTDRNAYTAKDGNKGGAGGWAEIGTWNLAPQCDCANQFVPQVRNNPPAPKPERVSVTELPVPPTAPSTSAGSCTAAVNPHATGCISEILFSGGFLPDDHQIVANVAYAGAPSSGPSSIYTGPQLIIVKTDGTTFSNGDSWKCVTCGIPAANEQGMNSDLSYPQPFNDGKRVLWGKNIVDCSPYLLADNTCTAAATHVYPITWDNQPAGFLGLRELRIHPDNVHIGFNHIVIGPGGFGEFGYYGRLVFDPKPTTGTLLVPRYDVVNATVLYNEALNKQPFFPDPAHPGELLHNPLPADVGEFRGFSKDGREAYYIGNPYESDNIDLFATDLTTGATRRLTGNPEYTDPADLSPDNNWGVFMDTRGSGRQLFMAAMEGIPPFNDFITVGAVSSVRNNRDRRFFQPWLIDRFGDRGTYQGQQLNGAGNGGPNAVNDPNWNGMADPRWSYDGTSVAYWQALVTSPACGGANPLPCPTYTDNGRHTRLMIARLTSRTPKPYTPPAPRSDVVPWGTPAPEGAPPPVRILAPAGTWTLRGQSFGSALVHIVHNSAGTQITHVDAAYTNFSDDGIHVINGTESADLLPPPSATVVKLTWHSNLTSTGCQTGTKITSEPGGFTLTIDLLTNILDAQGTLTTTIDGTTYRQPANGT